VTKVKIEFRPVRCAVIEASEYEMEVLKGVLKARPKGYFFAPSFKEGHWDGYVRFLTRKTFPSGLLGMVEKALKQEGIDYDVDYAKDSEMSWGAPSKDLFPHSEFVLRDNQIQCITGALKHKRGIVQGPPAAGKTVMMAAILKCLGLHDRGKQGLVPGVKTALIVCPNKGLLYQTHEEVSKFLQAKVGILGDGKKQLENVTVGIINTIDNMWKKDEQNFREYLRDVQVLMIDEAHRAETSPRYGDMGDHCAAPYRLAFSATPLTKGDEVKNMTMKGITGEVIAEITWGEQIEKGYSAQPHIHFVDLGWDAYNSCGQGYPIKGSTSKKDVYDKTYVDVPEKTKLIVGFTKFFIEHDLPTLILVERIPHGDALLKALKHLGDVRFVSGRDITKVREKIRKDFVARKFPVLISSKIFGEGINLPPAQGLILANETFKAEKSIQEIGRANRPDMGRKSKFWVIDFINYLHRHAYRRSLERVETFQGIEGFVVHKLNTMPEIKESEP
jgi:superfamily II DNA or RNA helicase